MIHIPEFVHFKQISWQISHPCLVCLQFFRVSHCIQSFYCIVLHVLFAVAMWSTCTVNINSCICNKKNNIERWHRHWIFFCIWCIVIHVLYLLAQYNWEKTTKCTHPCNFLSTNKDSTDCEWGEVFTIFSSFFVVGITYSSHFVSVLA